MRQALQRGVPRRRFEPLESGPKLHECAEIENAQKESELALYAAGLTREH